MDFLIDHKLFIALTGMKSGEHGPWAVDGSGIRSTLQAGGLTAHEEVLRMLIAEDTAVTWPVLASRLLQWQEKNGKILPKWVECVVGSSSLEGALAVLQQEYERLQAAKDSAALGILRARQSKGRPRAVLLYVADQKSNDVLLRAHAVELVLELVTSGDSGVPVADPKAVPRRPTSTPPKKGRENLGRNAVLEALKRLGASAASDARTLEGKVRQQLLKDAERAIDTDPKFPFRNDAGVLKKMRSGKWCEHDDQALISSVKSALPLLNNRE